MSKKSAVDQFEEIMRDLKNKIYHPVYFFCGEEPFYIDLLSDYMQENILDEMEREFNQTVVYGQDISEGDLIATCKRYPMMAEYQVVIVKEAQNMKKIEELKSYVENPVSSTILVLCHKYKTVDRRKEFGKMLDKKTVYYVSEKVRDYKLAEWIEKFVKTQKMKISPRSAAMLAEFLGNDLAKISNEIGKLKILFPEGTEISDEIIQQNIGISKDYNIFELQNSLGEKDILKSNRIVQYFAANKKSHPIQMTIPSLYGFFSKILKYHVVSRLPAREIAAELGVNEFFVRDYARYAKSFTPGKLLKVMEYLLEADLKSKGVNTTESNDEEIMKELVYKILH
ncbi:MAG TPA: DNA polymerase III subunit delta [Flavobacteriales bacterium]|nr:DNA polymerase III subunit delta [Flavobacteriales bacterium]HRJ37831.1 DNA polymerase III subunit delta [Flavobacteriales bacterium]